MIQNMIFQPVGVFDSGIGGISVLDSLIRTMPHESFLYYGDNLHAPYGTRSRESILDCCNLVMDYLMSRHVKAVVIACNTASSVAAAHLRETLKLPIIAMEPALKPAALLRQKGRILVLATPVTLHLEKFEKLYQQWGEGAVRVPCPGLMEMVEREDFTAARSFLLDKLSPWMSETIDAVVLGCTHYVFLRDLLRTLLDDHTAIIDGNEGTARQTRRVMENLHILRSEGPGEVELHTSGDPDTILPVMRRLLERMGHATLSGSVI